MLRRGSPPQRLVPPPDAMAAILHNWSFGIYSTRGEMTPYWPTNASSSSNMVSQEGLPSKYKPSPLLLGFSHSPGAGCMMGWKILVECNDCHICTAYRESDRERARQRNGWAGLGCSQRSRGKLVSLRQQHLNPMNRPLRNAGLSGVRMPVGFRLSCLPRLFRAPHSPHSLVHADSF